MHQPLPLGTILQNRYYLIDLLAQGKSNRTYLAKDLQSSNELRSLQEFTLEQTDAGDIQQLLASLQAKAEKLYNIQHPQIRQLYDIFAQEERLFFVQEFVEGKSCHTLLQERLAISSSFSQEQVWQILLMLLPALEYLHSIGISHGNISPETIILSPSPNSGKQESPIPILIDLAAEKELQNQITQSAKENTQPNLKTQPSPSSDLYSLAVTAVILLTGKQKAELIENGKIRKNWQQQTTVSPALARILNRMLSDNPKQRYSSAAEVAKELQALPALTTYKPKKNQPQYFWAYAISLSLVLVVGIGSWAVLYYLLSPLSVSPSTKSIKPNVTENTKENEKPVISRQILEAVPDKTVRVGGNLKQNETILYIISAKQWQTLTATVEGEGVSMRVLAPNQKPMPGAFQPIQRWEGGLFSPGDYIIQLNSKPEGGEQIEYKLEVRLAKYFPQKFCEDPSASSEGKWYPVLVPYKAEILNRLQAQFCRNTVVVFKDGKAVVQVGAFGEYSRAEAFASVIKSTSGTVEVGESFVGNPRRSCGESPENGKAPQYQVVTEYTKEKYIRILSYCPNASVRKRPNLSGSYIEVAAFADKSKAEAMAALISREVGNAEVEELLTQATGN